MAWQEVLKKTKVKLDLSTDIDMLLILEKGIGEEYVTLFIDMPKLKTNKLKYYDKIKNDHVFNIGMQVVWAMLQKFPVNNFEWIKNISQFDDDFMKTL